MINRRRFIQATGLWTLSSTVFSFAAERKPRILYFERSTIFAHPATQVGADGLSPCGRSLKKLGASLGYEVECTKDGRVFDSDLDRFDAIISYACGSPDQPSRVKETFEHTPAATGTGKQQLLDAVRGGKGFLAIHAGIGPWSGYDQEKSPYDTCPPEQRTDFARLYGARAIPHGIPQESTLTVVDSSLPWLSTQKKKIKHYEEWFPLKDFNPDIHVILVQETAGMDINPKNRNKYYNRPPFPCTWARREEKGPVAYTSLGHFPESWDSGTVPGVVSDLMRFITGKAKLDLTPNIEKVTPGANILKNP